MNLRSGGVDDTRNIGAALAPLLEGGDAVLLEGDLGAGKTALVQGIARGLGVDEPVVSPTFMIVRPYEGRLPLAHVDVYRLDGLGDLYDIGFEEVLDPGVVTVVEWGDRVAAALPPDRLEVTIEPGDTADERRMTFTPRGRWTERAGELEAALAAWKDDPC